MANIPIRDIPGAVVASPNPSNLIPMDNGALMQKTTIANAVNATLPLSSQAEAEAGIDNVKRMSSLRTKQAIDAQTPAIVNVAITALNLGSMSQEDSSDYTPTAGLAAVALSNDYNDLDNLPTLGTMSQETASDYTETSGLAAVALSNDYSDLDNLPTLGTAAATDASDYATAAQGTLASTAVQPGNAALVPAGGTIGQVLVKDSGTDYDTGWVSSAAATAVSYAPQTLTDAQRGQAIANIDAGLLSGFRNKLINGDFDIWQRGTSFTPSTGVVYTTDRWSTNRDGTGATVTVTRGSHTVGQTDVPGSPQYFVQYAQTVAGSGGAFVNAIQQPIEDVRTLSGKTVTVTVYAKATVGTPTVTPLFEQGFGTGGSPSAAVTTLGSAIALTPSWQKISQVISIPSITGKTIGTDGNSRLLVAFRLPANTTQTVQFSHISVVEGDATVEEDAFSALHIQQVQSLCERYCRVLGGERASQQIAIAQAYQTTTARVAVPGGSKMRANPSLTWVGSADLVTPSVAVTGIAIGVGGTDTPALTVTVASGLTAGSAYTLRTADTSSYITLDAEL